MKRYGHPSHTTLSTHRWRSTHAKVRDVVSLFVKPMIVIALVSSALGCEEDRDPQSPGGALRLFGVALAQNNATLINSSLSAQTKTLLTELLSLAKKINQEVKRFPGKDAQTWARQEALGHLGDVLNAISNEEELFQYLIKDKLDWAQSQPAGEVEQGLNQRRIISGSIQEGKVMLFTRADHQVEMRLEGSRWVVSTFEASLQSYVTALKASQDVLKVNRAEWIRRKKLNLDLPTAQKSGTALK